ncbi:hypothetical protein RI129_005030 [Pyrocoelia pectoralis]|uniref:RING-type E3 ubiquitin transferase BRCA1 n=1 Tax=Pyrocoelia pectoralis TaxID=417401 RepID=A0AAN7ZRU4_9COLE
MHAEIKQTEEFATLSKQHESKRFYIFCHHVFHLKNILKCSICLEIYDSPVELPECKHLFCQDCIDDYCEYTNGKSTCCPVCQKRFQKNDCKDHFFFKNLSEFTRFVLKHIYMVLGEKCNSNLLVLLFGHLPTMTERKIRMIEKNFLNLGEVNAPRNLAKPIVPNDAAETNVLGYFNVFAKKESSAFDALLKTPVQNKFFKQKPCIDSKVYIVKKNEKENTNPEHIHTVQQFENESNRTEILKWLENTNNEFDYKSFTQVHKIPQDIPDFDMPSISQTIAFKKPKFNAATMSELKKLKQMQNEMREKSNVLIRLSRSMQFVNNKRNGQEKRTRSLECCLKTIIPQPKVKRHSLPLLSQDEEIVIEQFDSEKDILHTKDPDKLALVNLMETEYLNAIDNELIKAESNLNVSRGWNRVKAVKKTFAKTERKSSKLKVTSLATSANTVNRTQINLRSKRNIRDTPPKTVEIPPINENVTNVEDRQKNEIESTRTSVNVEDKQSVLHVNDIEVAGAIVADKELQDDTSCKKILGNKKKIKTVPDFETVVTHAIIENRDLQEPFPTISNVADNTQNCIIASSVGEKPQLETSTIKNLEEKMSKIHGVEIVDKVDREIDCPKPVEFLNNVHPEAEDDDFIFTMPTQTIISCDIKQVNDDGIVNRLNNKIMSIYNILSIYLDDPSLKNTSLICKLKEILNEQHVYKSHCQETKSVHVQTTNNREDDSQESHYRDMGIQTDSFDNSNGFKISSTDMFNIQPVVSTAVQTEQFSCINCNRNVGNSLVAAQDETSPSVFKEDNFENTIPGKYNLSASFDNLTFETQDIVKGEQICLKSTTKLIASQSSAKDETDKQSQVVKESTNYKRVRQSSSESDTDNEKVKINATKKHKVENVTESENIEKGPQLTTNLLESNDISFEFLSDFDTNFKEASQFPKEIRNSIKPEEPSNKPEAAIKSATKVLTDVFEEPFPKRIKTQDIIKECEMIIKEACSTTLRIDHTHYGTEAIKLSLDGLEEEFNRTFEDDGNNNKNAKDKYSESIFSSAENKISQIDKQNELCEKVDHLEGLEDCFKDEFDKELQSSITQTMLKKDAKKIHVIQDILLPKPSDSHLEKVTEDKNEAEIFSDNASEKSDEIVDSDQEVIAATPQKSRMVPPPLDAVSMSQEKILLQNNYFIPDEILRPSEDNLLSCLNETFAPPPEFQDPDVDIIETQNHNDIEDIAPNASVTPDLLIHDTDARSQYAPLITSTPFSSVSQTLSTKTWNLSPIRSSHTYVNPILAAQNASRLPLTIIECKTPSKLRPLPDDTNREKNSVLKPNEMSSTNVSVSSKPNVCYTRLSTNQIMQVTSLATKKLITTTNTFGTTVTHMIVAVDKRNYLQDHTMKYVLAVAAGIWVLNFKWIEECLKQYEIVPEEPYEALDITGSDGPRRSRLTRSIAPLLENYKIYAAPPFRSTTKTELENVIKLLDGEVVSKPEDLLKKKGKVCLIITESSASQEDDLFEEWLEKLKVVTVDLEWLSRSVGHFQTSRLRPFALCSEESFSDLSYPAELLEDVPYSFTANIGS